MRKKILLVLNGEYDYQHITRTHNYLSNYFNIVDTVFNKTVEEYEAEKVEKCDFVLVLNGVYYFHENLNEYLSSKIENGLECFGITRVLACNDDKGMVEVDDETGVIALMVISKDLALKASVQDVALQYNEESKQAVYLAMKVNDVLFISLKGKFYNEFMPQKFLDNGNWRLQT